MQALLARHARRLPAAFAKGRRCQCWLLMASFMPSYTTLASAAVGALAMYCGGAMYSELPKPPCKRRVSFVMQLEGKGDENLAEYKKRHDGNDPYWEGPQAQLHRTLSENGVRNYSIFHLPATNQLFACEPYLAHPTGGCCPLTNLSFAT